MLRNNNKPEISDDAPETEWTFSPLAWPLPPSPFAESPLSSLSSPEIYPDNTWNPFDQSFISAQGNDVNIDHLVSSNRNTAFGTPIWNRQGQMEYTTGEACGDGRSYVSLSTINEPIQTSYMGESEEKGTSGLGAYARQDNSRQPDSNIRTRQPAWGSSRGQPRRHSTTSASTSTSNKSTAVLNHKRRKSSNPPLSPSALKVPRLRSTSTSGVDLAPRPNSKGVGSNSSTCPKLAKASSTSRTNHNQVEKQYRNRLNGQFETLLERLPQADLEVDIGGVSSGRGAEERGNTGNGTSSNGATGERGERRVSKAEVLVLAKRHIQRLEREKKALEDERGDLESRVRELRRRWEGVGGVVLG